MITDDELDRIEGIDEILEEGAWAEEAAISAHEQQTAGGVYGRWAWRNATEDDRQAFQIPDGYPPFIVFDWGEDDPVLAYCGAWYEADTVAARLARSDDPL